MGNVGREQEDGDFAYTVNDGAATIARYQGAGGAITIPATLGGYPTAAIGINAFNNAKGHLVTSIHMPDSVTAIWFQAFCECTALTSITIPDSVTTIGDAVFSGCSAMASVIIGNGVASIGKSAFSSCTSLASVTIPNRVTYIGYQSFSACTALTSVVFSGVTDVGMRAFADCTSLTSITFLGRVAPTSVFGGWIDNTPMGIRGHAHVTSNFPTPGNPFGGLTMGSVISATDIPYVNIAPASPPPPGQQVLPPAVARSKIGNPAHCPKCLAPISGSPLCGRCGYNLRREERLGAAKLWIIMALIALGVLLWIYGYMFWGWS